MLTSTKQKNLCCFHIFQHFPLQHKIDQYKIEQQFSSRMFCGDKWKIGIKPPKCTAIQNCSLPEHDMLNLGLFMCIYEVSECRSPSSHSGPEGLSPASSGGQSYGSLSDRHKPSICHTGKQTLVRQTPFLEAEPDKQGMKAKTFKQKSFLFFFLLTMQCRTLYMSSIYHQPFTQKASCVCDYQIQLLQLFYWPTC